jgi:asparagine synthase (glutamine-hydrolysing)
VSQIFGWVPADPAASAAAVVDRMAAALRVDDGQRIGCWIFSGLGIGVIEPPALPDDACDIEPASTADRRFLLWMAGEAFVSHDPKLPLRDAAESRTRAFRRALLDRWLEAGVEAVRSLDGEYHIAVWDAQARALAILNDRFGGLPLYWARGPRGCAFAGGVRGVLMAPDVPRTPDVEALREAVTFGGYRLEDRTNVESVRMVDGATLQTIGHNARTAARYWNWRDIPEQPTHDVREIVPRVHERWRQAVARRLTDRARYGQTLSGGLDSRAILAEAARGREWTAITYGVPGCDDAIYAERAAAAVGAIWTFMPLYDGNWLEARSAHIQATDGLIDLGDLAHMQSLPLQRSRFDVHLSGYVGDAVSGPTFAAVRTPDDVVASLPYYGASISMPYDAASARARELIGALGGAAARFATLANKLPQSTNRWTAAWRPWLRVRKPFVDYAFFDLCQGLPPAVRVEGRLHERWLRTAYPDCFASIPNQKTGLPILAPDWRVQGARIGRGARARLRRVMPARFRSAPRIRSYQDNDRVWRQPGTIDAITAPLLHADALCAGVFRRERIAALVEAWKARAAAPAQVIGALYVFETYHRELGRTLAAAAAKAGALTCERQAVGR